MAPSKNSSLSSHTPLVGVLKGVARGCLPSRRTLSNFTTQIVGHAAFGSPHQQATLQRLAQHHPRTSHSGTEDTASYVSSDRSDTFSTTDEARGRSSSPGSPPSSVTCETQSLVEDSIDGSARAPSPELEYLDWPGSAPVPNSSPPLPPPSPSNEDAPGPDGGLSTSADAEQTTLPGPSEVADPIEPIVIGSIVSYGSYMQERFDTQGVNPNPLIPGGPLTLQGVPACLSPTSVPTAAHATQETGLAEAAHATSTGLVTTGTTIDPVPTATEHATQVTVPSSASDVPLVPTDTQLVLSAANRSGPAPTHDGNEHAEHGDTTAKDAGEDTERGRPAASKPPGPNHGTGRARALTRQGTMLDIREGQREIVSVNRGASRALTRQGTCASLEDMNRVTRYEPERLIGTSANDSDTPSVPQPSSSTSATLPPTQTEPTPGLSEAEPSQTAAPTDQTAPVQFGDGNSPEEMQARLREIRQAAARLEASGLTYNRGPLRRTYAAVSLEEMNEQLRDQQIRTQAPGSTPNRAPVEESSDDNHPEGLQEPEVHEEAAEIATPGPTRRPAPLQRTRAARNWDDMQMQEILHQERMRNVQNEKLRNAEARDAEESISSAPVAGPSTRRSNDPSGNGSSSSASSSSSGRKRSRDEVDREEGPSSEPRRSVRIRTSQAASSSNASASASSSSPSTSSSASSKRNSRGKTRRSRRNASTSSPSSAPPVGGASSSRSSEIASRPKEVPLPPSPSPSASSIGKRSRDEFDSDNEDEEGRTHNTRSSAKRSKKGKQ